MANAYDLNNPRYTHIAYRTDDSEPNTWVYDDGTNSELYICMFTEETPKYEEIITLTNTTITNSTQEQNFEVQGDSLKLPHFETELVDQIKHYGDAWTYILPPLLDWKDSEILINDISYDPPSTGTFIQYYNQTN